MLSCLNIADSSSSSSSSRAKSDPGLQQPFGAANDGQSGDCAGTTVVIDRWIFLFDLLFKSFAGFPGVYVSPTANDPKFPNVKSPPENFVKHSNVMFPSSASPSDKARKPTGYNHPLKEHYPIGGGASTSGITPSFGALKSGRSYTTVGNASPRQSSTASGSYYVEQSMCNDMVMGLPHQPSYATMPPLSSHNQSYVPMDYVQQSSRGGLLRQSGCNQPTTHPQPDSPMTGVQMQQSPVLS